MSDTLSDEDLIGYLFDLLDPAERTAVAARSEADPETAARLDHLRAALTPALSVLDAERDDPPEPRPGLALRTIARVAEHIAEHEPSRSEPEPGELALSVLLREMSAESAAPIEFGAGTRATPPEPTPRPTAAPARSAPPPAPPPAEGPEYRAGFRLRVDLIVAAGIAFVGIGLVLSGVAKARYQSQMLACQNSLRTLHTGLTGYADADPQGRYPQVGTPEYPTADTFAQLLTERGFLPGDYKPGCPAGSDCAAYAYTLGYRGPDGRVLGLRRADAAAAGENDLMPIVADLPAAGVALADGSVSPHSACMNVLFVGGNVRPTTSPNVGPNGDDIYRNVLGEVAAGVNRSDAVLGGVGDRP
jgi:hypothetical protein